MEFPKVRKNNFIRQKQKKNIDLLSKIYIVLGLLLGLNRVPLLLNLNKSNYILTFLAAVYSAFMIVGLFYLSKIENPDEYKVLLIQLCEFSFCVILSLLTWKRLERYYKKLNTFDVHIGRSPKKMDYSTKNFIFMVATSIAFTSFYCLLYVGGYRDRENLYACLMPLFHLHFLELYLYGHLLSLIVPRVRLINCFAAIKLSNGRSTKWLNMEELDTFKVNSNDKTDMKRLIELYHIIIKAYDFLTEAVKWQLLVLLITTFISTLSFSYFSATVIIRDEYPLNDIIWSTAMMAWEMLPLFSPCICSDRIQSEVRLLRELLASRLYEDNLDKTGRSVARALLGLTETRDMSFTLLRILKIDVSLPFKFIGLLFTYLIIMLQFQKVINPSLPTTPSTLST